MHGMDGGPKKEKERCQSGGFTGRRGLSRFTSGWTERSKVGVGQSETELGPRRGRRHTKSTGSPYSVAV